MMMTWVDVVAAVLAAMVAAAYVCRLDMMHFRSARALAIVLHLVGLGVAMWVAAWSVAGSTPGLPDWAGLILATAWIAVTWPAWRHGIPAWARRAQNGGDQAT